MSLATDAIFETNLKSKRDTIQLYKRSFLQSSNVHTKFPPLMMAQSWAESTWEITNYGRFINQFPPNIIRSIRQFERINKKKKKYVDKKCLLCSIKYVPTNNIYTISNYFCFIIITVWTPMIF